MSRHKKLRVSKQSEAWTFRFARRMFDKPSGPERIMWAALQRRNRRYERDIGPRWKRQIPIGRYIADFYCAYLRTAIEVDGQQHRKPDAVAYDAKRDEFFASKGVRTIRIQWPFTGKADDILDGLLGVASALPGNMPKQVH